MYHMNTLMVKNKTDDTYIYNFDQYKYLSLHDYQTAIILGIESVLAGYVALLT